LRSRPAHRARRLRPRSAAPPRPQAIPCKGREKTQMCEGCHEIPGWRTAFPEVYHVPKIAGQHEAYIAPR
jgi:cytochrome c553